MVIARSGRCSAAQQGRSIHTAVPSEGLAGWPTVPGVGWSDHWSFWQQGYPAIMVTDTAPFRSDDHHTAADTVDRIDFERLARVVDGLVPVTAELAGYR